MNWLAVAIGGAIGACLRYALALGFAQSAGRFPLATFLANGLGCLLMGIGFMLIVERQFLGEFWRHLLLVGGLGALTTFSTFSIETLSLIHIHEWRLAALYALGSLILCLGMTALGFYLAKSFL